MDQLDPELRVVLEAFPTEGAVNLNNIPAARAKMEKYQKFRENHKNYQSLQQSMRGIMEMDKEPATKLTKDQAKKIWGFISPWTSKPTMTDAQAGALNKQVTGVLTMAQVKKMASLGGGSSATAADQVTATAVVGLGQDFLGQRVDEDVSTPLEDLDGRAILIEGVVGHDPADRLVAGRPVRAGAGRYRARRLHRTHRLCACRVPQLTRHDPPRKKAQGRRRNPHLHC